MSTAATAYTESKKRRQQRSLDGWCKNGENRGSLKKVSLYSAPSKFICCSRPCRGYILDLGGSICLLTTLRKATHVLLRSTKGVDRHIKKARRAFFAFGAMGAFHGQLNPISGRSIYESCVVPVLLFGCENWVLTDSMLHQLEGDFGRRILKLKTSLHTLYILVWPSDASLPARIFVRKLSFLSKVCEEGDSIFCPKTPSGLYKNVEIGRVSSLARVL